MALPILWTVGHSNHQLDVLVRLIDAEGIEFVADVRSYPYSRFAPQFNREDLRDSLVGRGIRYVFLGEELGGRPSKEEHFDEEGHALYETMSKEAPFQEAIDRLVVGAKSHRIALLCSEKDPSDCHRRLLVGKVLAERGVELRHILPDGALRVETSVELDTGSQGALFGEGTTPWRSTQSVSHRRRLNASSVG